MDAFALCMPYIFTFEGGYAQRDTEPGGAVNRGVSYATFASWRAKQGLPKPTFADLHAMSEDEATSIYRAQYADRIGFSQMPAGVNFCALDAAINDGVNWSLRELGKMANVSLTLWPKAETIVPAFNAWVAGRAVPSVIDRFCDDRLAHKETSPEWAQFHRGWTVRIEAVRVNAKAMATSA